MTFYPARVAARCALRRPGGHKTSTSLLPKIFSANVYKALSDSRSPAPPVRTEHAPYAYDRCSATCISPSLRLSTECCPPPRVSSSTECTASSPCSYPGGHSNIAIGPVRYPSAFHHTHLMPAQTAPPFVDPAACAQPRRPVYAEAADFREWARVWLA
ncbi:hypothetical protein PsYK624_153270 [Phanerochaete sordida]|uniref:Uncharacterized protein n=1 Tax=Phanerochaete sordida TaxID=48140 RepID=A0A9P3LLV3_9APHY|nr:hypothetical protein PsYK624_153270 [Phanerochaete sordida]